MQAAARDLADNGVIDIVGTASPTSGASGTGAGFAGPGSIYFSTTNGAKWMNFGTMSTPQWVQTMPAASGTGIAFNTRQRFTIAQVNAGATILAALTIWKYRLTDAMMIAVGGAASGATLVRIMATQGASAVALMGATVGALTQSTLVRIGAANTNPLADGASLVANDVNTPILIDKTGGSLATSTHIDVILHYQIEA